MVLTLTVRIDFRPAVNGVRDALMGVRIFAQTWLRRPVWTMRVRQYYRDNDIYTVPPPSWFGWWQEC
jgi:hypothetical protein